MYTITIDDHKFTHHLIDKQVYFESPITGELILMEPPYFVQKYHAVLRAHIAEASKLTQK